jgi:hypothetical protein
MQAGIIASEAFFAPLISAFPDNLFPPLITNLSTFPLVIAEVSPHINVGAILIVFCTTSVCYKNSID